MMKKFVLSLLLFITLVLAAAIFLPYIFKDQILQAIKKEANASMRAHLDFDNSIRINIFKSFPDLSIAVNSISIVPTDSAFILDTLISAEQMQVAIDLMKFYKNQEIVVKEFYLEGANLNLLVDENEAENWDIFIEDSSASSSISFQLDKLALEDCAFSYVDRSLDFSTSANNISALAQGKYSNDSLSMTSSAKSTDFNLSYAGIPYFAKHELKQEGLLALNLAKERYQFINNKVWVNALPLDANAEIQFKGEDIWMDITAKTANAPLSEFLSLIPAIYKTDYSSMIHKGDAKLSFNMKGLYGETSFPGFHLSSQINNGEFQYPDLKQKAKDIFLDFRLSCEDGNMNHTVLDIPNFHFKLGEDPFNFKLNMKNMFADPYIKTSGVGLIDLGKLKGLIPLEDGTQLDGKIYTKLAIEGTAGNAMNAPQNLTASGELEAYQLRYKDASMSDLLYISDGKFIFNNENINIPVFAGQFGDDDITLKGEISNYLAYLFNDGILKGNVQLYSKKLNLDHFSTESSTAADTGGLAAIEVPSNLDIEINAIVDNLKYGKYEFKNVQSNANVKESSLNLDQLSADLWGGNVQLSGVFSSKEGPFAGLALSYANLTVSELLKSASWIKQFAPIAEQVEANTLAKLSFSSPLTENMTPVLNQLNLGGTIQVENLMMEHLAILQQIDQKLGFQQFAVKKLQDLLLQFDISDGNLHVQPFQFLLDSSSLELQGVSKLDGSLAYTGTISIPSSYFSRQENSLNKLLSSSKITDYQYSPADYYKIAVKIGGSFYKPEVSLNLEEIKENVKSSLKQTITAEKDRLKQEAQKRAENELSQLRDTIDKSAEEAKQKMLAELERQKKEAEDKLKKEAEERKKKLKEEAEKKLKGLLK